MMKKSYRLISILLLAFAGCNAMAFAQDKITEWTHKEHDHKHENGHKGVVFAGGVLNLWYDNADKSSTIEFAPEVGYLLTDRIGIGAMLGFGFESELEKDGDREKSTTLRISPFLRYYYLRPSPFNLFIDAGVGYNMKSIAADDHPRKVIHGFEVGVRPGACLDLMEGLCLCIRLGFVGIRKNYFSGEEPEITSNGFGLRFAPEEAMIGLELEI